MWTVDMTVDGEWLTCCIRRECAIPHHPHSRVSAQVSKCTVLVQGIAAAMIARVSTHFTALQDEKNKKKCSHVSFLLIALSLFIPISCSCEEDICMYIYIYKYALKQYEERPTKLVAYFR